MPAKKQKKDMKKAVEVIEKKEDNTVKVIGVILTILVVIAAIYFISNFIFTRMSFADYQGLRFYKEKIGTVDFYRYGYNFADLAGGGTIHYNLYLRNNPAENKVPVVGEIAMPLAKRVYLGIDANLVNCSDTTISFPALSRFLSDNQFPVSVGAANLAIAEENNLTYISCDRYPDNVVIRLIPGTQTKIVVFKNCYTLEINNCEMLNAVEKFEVQSLIDARIRALNQTSA